MQQFDVLHFEEKGRTNPGRSGDQMPETEYATALDFLVFTCVDIAFTCKKQVLLEKRNQYPRKSWWIPGGRMITGESPLETAQRKALEEVQLTDLLPKRFKFIGVYSTCFAFRAQKPFENGAHTVNLTYQAELTDAEKSRLITNPKKPDSEWKWVGFNAIGQLLEPNNPIDQCLINIVQNLTCIG
jgi:ADP-ribose pyrophosphatase YjhB (NUDIX family)